MMKEKFAKLLLGEDMSGGAKGVCTAMAISNAITNLSGTCIFGCGSNSILPWSYCGLITAPWIVVYKTLLYPFFICTPFSFTCQCFIPTQKDIFCSAVSVFLTWMQPPSLGSSGN